MVVLIDVSGSDWAVMYHILWLHDILGFAVIIYAGLLLIPASG